jgi:hypothetical protein
MHNFGWTWPAARFYRLSPAITFQGEGNNHSSGLGHTREKDALELLL